MPADAGFTVALSATDSPIASVDSVWFSAMLGFLTVTAHFKVLESFLPFLLFPVTLTVTVDLPALTALTVIVFLEVFTVATDFLLDVDVTFTLFQEEGVVTLSL